MVYLNMAKTHEPERIERASDSGLRIRWVGGHESIYSWAYLRRSCPCALCRERPPRIIEAPSAPLAVEPVGRYAVLIRFSDGHGTGIFSHEYLRSICPCEECRPTEMTEG